MAKLLQINYPSGTTTNTIQITNPLKKDNSFLNQSMREVKRSLSGKEQVAFDYTEESKEIEITFETSTVRDELITMFQDHAGQGKTFDIIEDRVNFPAVLIECSMDTEKFKFEREAPGVDYWKIKFVVRKTL